MRTASKPDWQQKIAKERIEILLNLAEKEFKKHFERSKRYVELARKLGLRYNVRLTKDQKNKFCKKCFTLLKPGMTSKVRLDEKTKTIAIKCEKCNTIYRQPYK